MTFFLVSTLNRYFCRYFLFWFVVCLAVILCIVSLFEGIELLRRAMAKPDVSLSLIGEMVLLKLPSHINTLLPFVSFFASTLSLWRLNQNNELLVARAAGLSVWQLIGGLNIAVLFLHVVYLVVVNPIGAAMIGRYGRLEETFFSKGSHSLTVSVNGLWLCENKGQERSIIHAKNFDLNKNWFENITFYNFDKDGQFTGRHDAKKAILEDGEWKLTGVSLWSKESEQSQFYPSLSRPATVSLDKIEENYAAPETLSFWKTPDFIKTLKQTGLSARRYELYWHKQLAKGGLMVSLSFLAVLFCLYPKRYRQGSSFLGLGILCGFMIYFLSDIVYALGMAEKIPMILSVWLIPLVTTMLSIAYLLHIEHRS